MLVLIFIATHQGQQSFDENFSVLVAGGGTGNSICFLAEQLRRSKLTYVDLSRASMEIAKSRVHLRGLDNVQWVQNKLENIPQLSLGKFDYIESTGVLHHLPDPDLGLLVLSQSLKESGGINVMVYGRIGRTGTYQIQDLAKLVNEDVPDKKDEVANILKVIESMTEELNEETVARRILPNYGEILGDGTQTCNPELIKIKSYLDR